MMAANDYQSSASAAIVADAEGHSEAELYHDALSKVDMNIEPNRIDAAEKGVDERKANNFPEGEVVVLMPPAPVRNDGPMKTASATVTAALMSNADLPLKVRPISAPAPQTGPNNTSPIKPNNRHLSVANKSKSKDYGVGVFNEKVTGTPVPKNPRAGAAVAATTPPVTPKYQTATTASPRSTSSPQTPVHISDLQVALPAIRHQQSPFQYEKYKQYKKIAETAHMQRKIFSIIGGYQSVRRALLRRGWQERLLESQFRNLQSISHHSLLQRAKPGNEYEKVAISKLLQPYPSFFLWYPRNTVMTRFDHVVPFKSRLSRDRLYDFTLKDGLINCNDARHWQYIPGRSELTCPRSYRLYMTDEMDEFMKDYRFTGCTSLLAFLVAGIRTQTGTNACFSENSATNTVPHKSIEFALCRIRDSLRRAQHEDIEPNFVCETLESAHWREFFRDFHAVVRCGSLFAPMVAAELARRQQEWKTLLQTCRKTWPTMDTDGFMNIWIMKPAGHSCGVGVTVMQDNLRIVETASKNKRMRYLVQKYLERPLLIYKTKFDIRQYFLMVGRANVIQVWMYKMSYLKFSSQEFSLRNFHESVHLTNHTVQKHYTNAANRSVMLPTCNMWSSLQFQNYLESIGEKDKWMSRIYPAMKRNVVAAVRSAYEQSGDLERNCFELVGGDFMVTENFDVQLLEVNATPDMYPSTPVTRQICADCLEDVVKVVVDRFNDPNAPTGYFELIYEIPMPRGIVHSNLCALGKQKKLHMPSSLSARAAPVSPQQRFRQQPVPRSAGSQSAREMSNRQRVVVPIRDKINQQQTKRPMTSVPPAKTMPTSARGSDEPVSKVSLASKWRMNSKQILDDLAGRLLQNSSAAKPKAKVKVMAGRQQGLSLEVGRLMQLNQTIERLLNSRSRSCKQRQNIVNQFLAARQSQSMC